ncbi:DUF4238 domain-containing protein [Arthrobacter bambusae]|uniref:DUF4238 domain-containing protein n=1 Tax=Arthrobacter bambusae TaxID=1338426 RepID=UPI002781427E|nr:DUF4238 domain-containing protein [Arthrobacter bambusae]MDQ0242002.1 hypothetical protein [Arthrobacter bambusae]
MKSKPGRPSPKRQHYVSQVLLKQFSGVTNGEEGICQIEVVDGRTIDPKPSKSMGFEWHMFKHKGEWMEKLWQEVEGPMGHVNSILANGRPEDVEPHKIAVTDFIALHFARSLETKRIHRDSYEKMERQTRANREMQLKLAAIRYPMLDLALAPSVLDSMSEAVLEPIQAQEAMGSPFQEFVESAFARTRQQLSNYSLSIRPALSGTEYLLGDCPAVGVARGMNPRRRPPLFEAKALIMPLSTQFVAFVYPRDSEDPDFSVDPTDREEVLAINQGQIAQAHKRVFYRPGSGHQMTARTYLGLGQVSAG